MLFATCLPFFGTSQQLTPSVIASSGGFYSNANGFLSFTAGELAAVETYAKPNAFLTQGFQQPWDLGVGIIDHPIEDFSFGLYPNPSDGDFFVMTESRRDLSFQLSIHDIVGKEIFAHAYKQESEITIHDIDISKFTQGTYILSLRILDNITDEKAVLVHKITLVK